MKRHVTLIMFFAMLPFIGWAQIGNYDNYNEMDDNGNFRQRSSRQNVDSLGTDKEIPKGLKVWTVDSKFGDIRKAEPDTLSHMYMNSIFTTGKYGEYNTLGNVGSPRISRIFIDRNEDGQFIFTLPYDFFVKPVDTFHFTNTLSPFTNLNYNTCGNRTNGEDHLTAKFGVNSGKRLGVGFNFDYIYGRGFYKNQSTSHFNYTMYGSYLGDRYQAHVLMSTNHQKVTENGGITNDYYITHPESFDDDFLSNEIPTVLEQNWNRNDNQHIFFTQRYNVGFNRKVKMTEEEIKARKFAIESKRENDARKKREEQENETDNYERIKNAKLPGITNKGLNEQTYSGRPDNAKVVGDEPKNINKVSGDRIAVTDKQMSDSLLATQKKEQADTAWMKTEYVPVTSFIHTLKFDNYKRIYQAYQSPTDFYANDYKVGPWGGDSIYDKTKYVHLSNTFAISLLEGFNKWAKAGLKAFATSELRHFSLPALDGTETSYTEHNVSIGGQLSKTAGKTLHYDVTAETWLVGEDAGQLKIDATADVNFPLWGDTVTLMARGFFKRTNPTFYYRHYHARHFWWDNDNLDKILHSRIEGQFHYSKTKTTLRVAVDEIQNYTYMAMGYNIADDKRTGNTIDVRQKGGSLSLITLALGQNFKLGPLNWENMITYQKSTDNDVLPVPDLNIYTNLYYVSRLPVCLNVILVLMAASSQNITRPTIVLL